MKTLTSTVSEITVSYYPSSLSKPTITSSKDAHSIFREFFPENTIHLQERFVVMYLNRCNRVLGVYPVSSGGITGTVADVRIILSVALKVVATSIMLAHNHPSGSLKPSKPDIELTSKIKEAAKYMDITLMDHLILSPEEGEYLSFADEALL